MANSKNNQKYLIIVVALALAAAGYYGYKSMMVKPDINKVTTGERGATIQTQPKTPSTTKTGPVGAIKVKN